MVAVRIAITVEACHAVAVLEEAFARHGTPEIINADQGSQFTVDEFIQAVKDRGVGSAWTAERPSGTTSLSSGYSEP
jgi:putative transposase